MYICIYVYMYICIYVYMYMYTHTHTHTHTHTLKRNTRRLFMIGDYFHLLIRAGDRKQQIDVWHPRLVVSVVLAPYCLNALPT